MNDDLDMISEITLLPDGRVHVHGVTREVLALLHDSGIGCEIVSGLLRLSGGEPYEFDRYSTSRPGDSGAPAAKGT